MRSTVLTKVAMLISLLLCIGSHFSTQENIPHGDWSDAVLGHYQSLLPSGINLNDISSGHLYVYNELSPEFLSDTLKLAQGPTRRSKHRSRADSIVVHKCKYCAQRQKQKAMRNASARQRSLRRTPIKKNQTVTRKKYASASSIKSGRFSWPISPDKFWISCYFGRRSRGRMHKGLDLAAVKGTPVRSSAAGYVELACPAGTFGNMVLIRHSNGYKSRYAHLQSIAVKQGSFIPRGRVIGYVGNTGRVTGKTGDHLHFEILVNNRPVNPIYYLV